MSIDLRDQRVRLYTYSNAGGVGFTAQLYTFRAERWTRAVEVSAYQRTAGGVQAQERVDAVLEVDDEVEVFRTDLAIVVGTEDRFFVRGITRRPFGACLLLACERIEPNVFKTLQIGEGEFEGDGVAEGFGFESSIAES